MKQHTRIVASKAGQTFLWTEAAEGLWVLARTPFTASTKGAERVVLLEGPEPPAGGYARTILCSLGIGKAGWELSMIRGTSIGGVDLRHFWVFGNLDPLAFLRGGVDKWNLQGSGIGDRLEVGVDLVELHPFDHSSVVPDCI